MPPPPVDGAPAGVCPGLVFGSAVTVTVTVARGVAAAVVAELVPVLDALLADVLVDVDEVELVGGGIVPDELGVVEHPATAMQARMAKKPKPMTVSFALGTVPAGVTRTVM